MSKSKKNKQEEQKLNPYSIDKLSKIPAYLKIGFLKFWLAGACFLLTFYGLGAVFAFWDRVVIFALLLILGVEYVSNTLIIWMNKPESSTLKYLPHEVNRKSFLSFLATALYVMVMLVLINYAMELWAWIGIATIGELLSEATIDPISFGLLFVLFDYIWITIRKLIKKQMQRRRNG